MFAQSYYPAIEKAGWNIKKTSRGKFSFTEWELISSGLAAITRGTEKEQITSSIIRMDILFADQ